MNVSISYVVELEKLPSEVKKLLVEARQTLEGSLLDSFEQVEEDFSNENYFRILKDISEIRKQLYAVDTRLDDCHNILSGFQKLLLEKEQEGEVNPDQLALDFEGTDVVIDEEGKMSLEANEDGQG